MIDPNNITKFNCSDEELQEQILFWIAVAGKKASNICKALDRVLNFGKKTFNINVPFEIIKKFDNTLPNILNLNGIGCYNLKAKSMIEISKSNLNLRNCSAEDLEKINGIGYKTSRCFILHTRKNARYAGIDTHLLKFLNSLGFNYGFVTPNSKKKYLEIEKIFLQICDLLEIIPSEMDLEIWKAYSSKNDIEIKKLLNLINGKLNGLQY